MNGFGVGVSVALGWGIGAGLSVPEAALDRVMYGMLFFGMISGFVFHLYKWALRGVRLPPGRR